MRNTLVVILWGLLINLKANGQDYTQFVDPIIGSSESRYELFPGPSMPHGMVKLSPDGQDRGWKSGYEYTIQKIKGFSHIHSWGMTGLRMMPTTGYLKYKAGKVSSPVLGAQSGYLSRFTHDRETAEVGYYSVDLLDYKIKAELTSSMRCGFQRYTFPKAKEARILVDMMSEGEYGFKFDMVHIRKVSPTEIEGKVHMFGSGKDKWNDFILHFVIRTNKPMTNMDGWRNGDGIAEKDLDSLVINRYTRAGVALEFSTEEDEEVLVQSGISLVSIDQARLNLTTELDPFNWNFESVVQHQKKIWNDLLSKIEVKSKDTTALTKFYTNLYRAYSARNVWSDVNGKYRDACENIQTANGHAMMGSDAFWNTYWNLNQVWSLVTPDVTKTWVKTFLEMYKETGWLPKGPSGIEYSGIMHGMHSIPLIVSAYQKGIITEDAELAYEACKKAQMVPGYNHECSGKVGNEYLASYMEYGYVPQDIKHSSFTLDYAFDDWCVARFAELLGKKKDQKYFDKRALSYKNIFDPETKYFRPKYKDGSWKTPFSLFESPGWAEGNAWQYFWYVPHDLSGLIDLVGVDTFNERLEYGFKRAEKERFTAFPFENLAKEPQEFYVNHGNQVNMQAAYLFNFSGKPDLTQKYVKAIRDVYYGTTPLHGWLGDEDEGQMSAWYVMACLGIFEMDGGAGNQSEVTLTPSAFEEITIHLDQNYYKGKHLVIKRKGSLEGKLKTITWNGKPLKSHFIAYSELVKGGVLEYNLE